MRTIVVNFLAGPGAGKSTTSAAVFSLLKLHDVNVELVTEVAKDFTWEERYKTLKNQYYIWAKQQHRIWRIKDEVDIVVTDSPLVFSLVYGESKPDHFYSLVLEDFNNYDNMNYFLTRVKPYHPAGRYHTEEEAKILDDMVKFRLKSYNIPYNEILGNIDGINTVVKDVLDKIGKEKIYCVSK